VAGQPTLAPMDTAATRRVPPYFGVSASEVAVDPVVSVLPGTTWEVEVSPGDVTDVCVDGAVVVVDPPSQAASRSVPTTRRLTSRMTESLTERDFMRDSILVLPP
jgi:hypothetical protein